MNRTAVITIVVSLTLLIQCEQASTTFAQGLTNTIPRNQAPLARTFPPSVAEQTPSGIGKFVLFTREETDKPNEWDFIAGAWECIPSRPNVPITRRVEFCHAAGHAEPLLDTLVIDDSEGLFPRFVQLHVDTANLYDINYRTWEVRCLRQGEPLRAFGVMKDSLFCTDSHDWFRLNTVSGKITEDVPFIPQDVDGAFWLVRKVGKKSEAWSYDVTAGRFVGHFGEVDDSKLTHSRSLLSQDGRNRAWILVPVPNDRRDGFVSGDFLLQRDGYSDDIRVPVTLQTKFIRGSGRLNPVGTRLVFTDDGRVIFAAKQQLKGKTERVWAIDVATGTVKESVQPFVEPKPDDFAFFDGVPTPDYLRPYLKDLWHFGRGGLAPAFLMHLGVLKKQPEFPDCTAGVSPDGRHILFKAREGKLADVFIYGDLQTKQTVRWTSPAGIKPGDSLEFVWVETP